MHVLGGAHVDRSRSLSLHFCFSVYFQNSILVIILSTAIAAGMRLSPSHKLKLSINQCKSRCDRSPVYSLVKYNCSSVTLISIYVLIDFVHLRRRICKSVDFTRLAVPPPMCPQEDDDELWVALARLLSSNPISRERFRRIFPCLFPTRRMELQ